jgi:hypothetical protein
VELFYIIADRDCAEARKELLASAYRKLVKFRNLIYPEVEADFKARGGEKLPAFWDGETLHQGLEAIRVRIVVPPPS